MSQETLALARLESASNGHMSSRSKHDKGDDRDDGGFEERHDRLNVTGECV